MLTVSQLSLSTWPLSIGPTQCLNSVSQLTNLVQSHYISQLGLTQSLNLASLSRPTQPLNSVSQLPVSLSFSTQSCSLSLFCPAQSLNPVQFNLVATQFLNPVSLKLVPHPRIPPTSIKITSIKDCLYTDQLPHKSQTTVTSCIDQFHLMTHSIKMAHYGFCTREQVTYQPFREVCMDLNQPCLTTVICCAMINFQLVSIRTSASGKSYPVFIFNEQPLSLK